MSKCAFTKLPRTYEEQVNLLKSRGMVIDDEEEAKFYLSHLNYYRIGAYWLPFEADHTTHQFRLGTKFGDVLQIYKFDGKLRLLVMEAIELIEVSLRSQWAYNLAHCHGTHAHLKPELAKNRRNWDRDFTTLKKEVARSNETFIKHLNLTYSEALPPVWAICEVMSFGLLSKWYENLGPMSTRKKISNTYSLNEQVLASWLRHLTTLRNICAHHSRLWNRDFVVIPIKPKSRPRKVVEAFVDDVADSRKIYNSLIIMLHFMDTILPNHGWRNKLRLLLDENEFRLQAMGFPNEWQSELIWQ